jgi:hypothetical protein
MFSPSTSVSPANHSTNFVIVIIGPQSRVNPIELHPPLYQLKKKSTFLLFVVPQLRCVSNHALPGSVYNCAGGFAVFLQLTLPRLLSLLDESQHITSDEIEVRRLDFP